MIIGCDTGNISSLEEYFYSICFYWGLEGCSFFYESTKELNFWISDFVSGCCLILLWSFKSNLSLCWSLTYPVNIFCLLKLVVYSNRWTCTTSEHTKYLHIVHDVYFNRIWIGKVFFSLSVSMNSILALANFSC